MEGLQMDIGGCSEPCIPSVCIPSITLHYNPVYLVYPPYHTITLSLPKPDIAFSYKFAFLLYCATSARHRAGSGGWSL